MTTYNDPIFKIDGYVGVYCNSGYGVFTNSKKLSTAIQYINKRKSSSRGIKCFSSYNAALAYAQNGICKILDIDDAYFLPKLDYKTNWIQWISSSYPF